MIRQLYSAALIAISTSLAPVSAFSQVLSPQTPGASSTVTVAQNTVTPQKNKAYTLGPGDEIQLTMPDQPGLFTINYRVLFNGKVTLPLIGRVAVAGLSIGQAERAISLRYARIYKSPYVTMALANARTVTQTPEASSTESSSLNTVTPQKNSLVNDQAYILGPEDEIQLQMFGQPDLFTKNYRVLVDGTVNLPLIGRVVVAGLSFGQAEKEISLRYTRLYERPYVTMVLVNAQTVNLPVTSEVESDQNRGNQQ